MGVASLRHAHHTDDHQQQDEDDTNKEVGLDEDAQIMVFHHLKLGLRETQTIGGVERTHARLNKVHGYKHSQQRPDGIESLGQVETLCGGLLTAHTVDIGIAAGLKK